MTRPPQLETLFEATKALVDMQIKKQAAIVNQLLPTIAETFVHGYSVEQVVETMINAGLKLKPGSATIEIYRQRNKKNVQDWGELVLTKFQSPTDNAISITQPISITEPAKPPPVIAEPPLETEVEPSAFTFGSTLKQSVSRASKTDYSKARIKK